MATTPGAMRECFFRLGDKLDVHAIAACVSELRPLDVTTYYYRWEGDACRLHIHPNGNYTADIYRAKHGILEINHPSDLFYRAVRISQSMYEELVAEEESLSREKPAKKGLRNDKGE